MNLRMRTIALMAIPLSVAFADPVQAASPASDPKSAATSSATATSSTAVQKFRDSPEHARITADLWQRDQAKAYEALAPLAPQYAGDVEFDYMLGSAALDAGHPSAAIFALQRAVAVSPDFPGARLELARAYFAAGDNESARREFLILQNQRPPANVAEAIAQYIESIDARSISYRRRYGAVLEAGAGFDSNANGATDTQVFLGFNLNDRSRAKSSAYYSAAASGQLSYPLVSHWRLFGDAGVQQRNYPSASFVDATQARLGGGAEWSGAGPFSFSGGLSGTYAALDGSYNNLNTALDLVGTYAFLPEWQAGANLRVSALRFDDALSAQDVNSVLGGLALTRSWRGRWPMQLTGAVTAGNESAQEDNSIFGRKLTGGRVTAFMEPRRNLFVSATAAFLNSDYDDDGSVLGHRSDDQTSAGLSLDLKDFPARLWGIGAQLMYVDNRSNIELFEYDRVVAGATLKREFR